MSFFLLLSAPAITLPVVYLLLLLNLTNALTQDYCNEDLPSDATYKEASDYMSNGLCVSDCQGYKFAIVQFKNCWCSNENPGNIVSVSNCNEGCPGYSIESCGSGSTYFGWLEVSNDYISGASASSFSYSSILSSSQGYSSATLTSSSSYSSSFAYSSSVSVSAQSSIGSSSVNQNNNAASSNAAQSSTSTSSTSTSSTYSSSTSSSSTSSSSTYSSSTSSSSTSTSSTSSTSTSQSSTSSSVSTSSSSKYTTSITKKSSTPVETIISTIQVTTISQQSGTGSNIKVTSTSDYTQTIQSIYTTFVVSTTIVPSNSEATGEGSANGASTHKSSGFWQSKGKVAGTFVVVGLVILLLILLLVYLFIIKPRNESKRQHEFEKTYNEIIQSNLRDSVDSGHNRAPSAVAVNNALVGFQEFDSDISSNNYNEKNAFGNSNIENESLSRGTNSHHGPEDSAYVQTDGQDFNPEYEMIGNNEDLTDEVLTNDNLNITDDDHYSDGEEDLSNDNIFLPPGSNLGALKVVNRSITTIENEESNQ